MQGDLAALNLFVQRGRRAIADLDPSAPEQQLGPMLDGVEAYARYWSGDLEGAMELSQRTLDATTRGAPGWSWTAGFHMMGQSLAGLGRGDEAHAMLEQMEEADFEGGSRFLGNIATVRAAVDLMAGEVRGVLRHARSVLAARDVVDVSDHWIGCVRYGLGVAAYEGNDLDEAARQFDLVRELPYSMPGFVHHAAIVGASLTARARGDGLAAQQLLDESLAYAVEMRDSRAKGVSESLALRLSAGEGGFNTPPEAMVDATVMGPWLEFPVVTYARAAASGRMALSPDAALARVEQGLEAVRPFHARRVILALELARAVLLGEAGRSDASHKLLKAALDECQGLQLTRTILDSGGMIVSPLRALSVSGDLAAYRDQLLAALEQEPARWAAPQGPGPDLTPRERDVLGLLTQRLSNTEIAERLFVGPETVKSHLASIYRKLGVGGRREALARVRAESGSDGR
jgi:LuxR family maltose regulon positive regulatory protein